MTRAAAPSMQSAPSGQGPSRVSGDALRSARTAALHRQGGEWRVVIVEALPGAGGGERFRLVEARTLAAEGAAEVRGLLRSHGVDRLLRVIPARSVVCRVIEAPEGRESELAPALSLIAEASLPSSAPAHRRACGLLSGWVGGVPAGSRPALIVGWHGDADEEAVGECEEFWVGEPVALGALLCSGQGGVALHADRATGSIGVAAVGPERAAFRALREESSSAEAWGALLDERLSQTAAATGSAREDLIRAARCGDQELRLDDGSARALGALVRGLPGEGDWTARYGVALGAALGAARAGPGARALFGLTAQPARAAGSPARRLAEVLSRPVVAAWVIAAGLGLALVAPLGAAWARHAVLLARSGGVAHLQEVERRAELERAFLDQLERRRWPMTKLLADLSGALPVGVILESVRLEQGQRAAVRGFAESLDLVNQLQARLNESGVFDETFIDRTQGIDASRAPTARSTVEFELSARVARPFGAARGLEDFAAAPLAQRLYGERALMVAGAEAGSPAREDGDGRAAGGGGGRRARGASAPAAPVVSAARQAPEPLTDEQIAALDASAAMREWTTRQTASKREDLDAETRERLRQESEKARSRMQAARREGGS